MSLFRALLDLIYPPRCSICNEFLTGTGRDDPVGNGSICERCYGDFHEIEPPFCPICSRPFPIQTGGKNHLCEACLRKSPAFKSLSALFRYEGTVMEAIHRFKYQGKTLLADSLGPLLGNFARKRFSSHKGPLLVIPVPLHPKRLRHRGFNQSLLLARHVAKSLDTDLDFLSLRRTRHTVPQIALGKDARQKNMRGAFQVVRPAPVQGKAILLVDDVSTTGCTLNECAKVLRRGGSKEVFGLVLARTSED